MLKVKCEKEVYELIKSGVVVEAGEDLYFRHYDFCEYEAGRYDISYSEFEVEEGTQLNEKSFTDLVVKNEKVLHEGVTFRKVRNILKTLTIQTISFSE